MADTPDLALNEMKERRIQARLHGGEWARRHYQDVGRLLAEVERLRAERDRLVAEADQWYADKRRAWQVTVDAKAEHEAMRRHIDNLSEERNRLDRMLTRCDEARERVIAERDLLRELLVSAEGYALANGANLPFSCMFVDGTPQAEAIERAGCYPRNARLEYPGRFALNPPPDDQEDDDVV